MKKSYVLVGIIGILSFCGLDVYAAPQAKGDGFATLNHVEGLADPMSGKEADFAALESINNIRDYVHKAKQAHNKKQSLASFREILEKYKQMQAYHAAVQENLRISEECVNHFADKHYQNSMLSWRGKNCGFYQLDMYCHYDVEKKSTDDSASKGDFDILCPGDMTHKCYVKSIGDMTERAGISGYLLGLYAEAKKQEATNSENAYLAEGDFEKFEEGLTEGAEDKKSPYISPQDRDLHMNTPRLNELTADKNYDDKSNQQIKHPSEQKDVEAEARKNGLLNWTLGSVVSKEMANDLVSPSPRFAQAKKKFPLWNDQKEFYDQYIAGKYANIKDYMVEKTNSMALLANIAKQAANLIPFTNIQNEDGTVITAEQQKQQNLQKIAALTEGEENLPEDTLEQKLQANAKKYEAIRKNAGISNLLVREQAIYSELDRLGDELDEAQEAYSNSNEVIADSESTIPEAKEALAYVDELYADRDNDDGVYDKNPLKKELNATINNHEYDKVRAEGNKATLEEKVNRLRAQINQKNKELEDVQKAVNEAKKLLVLQMSDAISQNAAEMDQQEQNLHDSITEKINVASEIPVFGIVTGLSQCIGNYASTQIDKALDKYKAMQDSEAIYYSVNADEVQKIHKDLIDKLTNINLETLDCDFSVSNAISAEIGKKLLAQMLNLLEEDCKDEYCTTPDDDYFVGIKGKRRDLKAPKSPVEFTSAPLREVFHFDMQDYDNVDKYYKGDDLPWNNQDVTVTAESFLQSGADIPVIWQYILREHAFVEKDMNWKSLFERGNPQKAYLRSGTFPCLLEGKVIDVRSDALEFIGYTIDKTADVAAYKELPQCRGLSITTHKGKKYVVDNEVKYGLTFNNVNDVMEEEPQDITQTSELGNILAYVPDMRFRIPLGISGQFGESNRYKLTFNPALQKAAYWANQEILQEEKQKSLEHDAQIYLGTRSLLTRNQFGDYLNNVEMERKAVDMLDELQTKIIDLQTALKTMFSEIGYDLPDDIDLTNDADFKEAGDKLDAYKGGFITRAEGELAKLNVKTEKVQDDIDAVKHEIAVMKKDRDEKVVISGDEDLDELDEKIKNYEANQALNQEYQKKVAEEMARQISAIPAPYCSSYYNK